jgi:GTP-binding protein
VLLIDGKVGATELDVAAWARLQALGFTPLVVATKIDRLKAAERNRHLGDIALRLELESEDAVLALSARTGEGIRELWRELVSPAAS